MMRKFSSAAVCAAVALAIAAAGCGKIGDLQGKMAFRDANGLYQAQDYRKAAAKYEAVIAAAPDTTDPDLTTAYFFLGNSYDNLYRASRAGEAENDAMLTKAITNYKKAAEVVVNPQIKSLALQYLVAAYGPDKLNDPSQAETILKQMIEMDPKDTSNYFVLSKIYQDAGDYEQAEAQLLKAKEAAPSDVAVLMQLAGFYNTQGEFPKTIEALEQRVALEPNNPEAHHTVATYYWDEVYRDFRLPEAEKRKYIQAGLDAVDKALALNADYFEAITYKNLLLRLQANLEKDAGKQQALLKEADRLRDRALELRKTKTAGAGD